MADRATCLQLHMRFLCGVLTLVLTACEAGKPETLIGDGKTALAKQEYATAVIQFKSALQKDPKSVDARLLLGQALQASGDSAGAAVEFAKALEQGAAPERGVPLVAQAMLRAGEFKKLVSNYDEVVLKDGDAQAVLKSSLYNAWVALGDRKKADLAFDAATAASPDSSAAVQLRVRRLAAQNNVEAAVDLLDKLLSKDAKNEEAWLLKGGLLSIKPDTAKASEPAYRKALDVDRSNVWAHFYIVSSQLRDNNLADAKVQFKAMREVQPKHALTAFVEAELAYAEGDFQRSREITQKLMQKVDANVGLLQLAGSLAFQSRELVQAESYFSKAMQLAPESPAPRHGMSMVYLRLGQPGKALAILSPLLGPDSTNGEALASAGEAELALGDAKTAESYFTRASKAMPGDSRVKTTLALTRLARGDREGAFADLAAVAQTNNGIVAEQAAFSTRLRSGEYDAALAVVDQIARKQPNNSAVYSMRGQVHLARRDLVQARKAFEDQQKADPALFTAIANLAAIDILDKKPEEARKRLQGAIKADPKNMYAILSLAKLQADAGATGDEIKQLLQDAIRAAPREAEPRMQLIALTLRMRLYKEALVAAQEAVAALPGDIGVLDAVGRAQMAAGDVEQALSTFRKMAGIEEKSGLAYMRLADIYQTTGKLEQSESALRKALEIEPDLKQAQSALIGLMVRTQRKAEAQAFIQRQLRAAPDQAFGYNLESAYYVLLGDTNAALASFRMGVAKTGQQSLALGLHHLLGHLQKYDEADRFAANWLKDHPKDGTFLFQTAELAIKRGQYPQAQTRLLQLAAQSPDDALVLNNLAAVMVQQGQAGALQYAQKAADLAPKDARVLDTLAAAQSADKQLDKALATQKRAVEIAPESEELRLHLASIALQAGEKTLARSELARLQGLGTKLKRQDEVSRLLKTL